MLLTQSLLKELENPLHCPLRIQKQWITKEIDSFTNESMLRGKYFEQQCIGQGAIKDEVIEDLPRLKNGEKSVSHQRIDLQVLNFKKLFDKNNVNFLGFEILSIQERVIVDGRGGTLDIKALNLNTGRKCIIDLKLTGTIDYGYYSKPEEIDKTQATNYISLLEKKYGEEVDFYLLVFDYSKELNITLFQVLPTVDDFEFLDVRFEKLQEVLMYYEETYKDKDYPANPSESQCSTCQYLSCPFKFTLINER